MSHSSGLRIGVASSLLKAFSGERLERTGVWNFLQRLFLEGLAISRFFEPVDEFLRMLQHDSIDPMGSLRIPLARFGHELRTDPEP